MIFIPMVLETFWGWEESAVLQLKRLVAALALYQRLAILLVKGNASLFLNRLPSQPSPILV